MATGEVLRDILLETLWDGALASPPRPGLPGGGCCLSAGSRTEAWAGKNSRAISQQRALRWAVERSTLSRLEVFLCVLIDVFAPYIKVACSPEANTCLTVRVERSTVNAQRVCHARTQAFSALAGGLGPRNPLPSLQMRLLRWSHSRRQ